MKSNKGIILATILGTIAYTIFDMFYHGSLMAGYYEETKHLWRSEAGMEEYRPYGMLSTFFVTLLLAIIFSMGYENKGTAEGVRFGTLFGLLFAAMSISWYAYMPLTPEVIIGWVIGSLVSTIIVGVVFAISFGLVKTK